MFKIAQRSYNNSWSIADENNNYMHADGTVFHKCGEYWPTREQAQDVLNEHQPAHVWKHGDVFVSGLYTQIYLKPYPRPITCVLDSAGLRGTPDIQLQGATFLFNIRDILSDRGVA